MRKFIPSATDKAITVKNEGKEFNLAPAEVEAASSLILAAMRMEQLPSIPDKITNKPFVVRFFNEGEYALALERTDKQDTMPFNWGDGDPLISALQDGLAMAVNERTLVGSNRGTGYVPPSGEPYV
jgi:hypothetical protein